MEAKATPCGRTTTAPVSPALKSAGKVTRLISFRQARKGKSFNQIA